MKFNLNIWLMQKIRDRGPKQWPPIPTIFCKDGTRLSVQVSDCHYCEPRSFSGPWETVEVGFPSIRPPRSIMAYAEDRKTPTDTVYPYVPIDLVERFIVKHGGIA